MKLDKNEVISLLVKHQKFFKEALSNPESLSEWVNRKENVQYRSAIQVFSQQLLKAFSVNNKLDTDKYQIFVNAIMRQPGETEQQNEERLRALFTKNNYDTFLKKGDIKNAVLNTSFEQRGIINVLTEFASALPPVLKAFEAWESECGIEGTKQVDISLNEIQVAESRQKGYQAKAEKIDPAAIPSVRELERQAERQFEPKIIEKYIEAFKNKSQDKEEYRRQYKIIEDHVGRLVSREDKKDFLRNVEEAVKEASSPEKSEGKSKKRGGDDAPPRSSAPPAF